MGIFDFFKAQTEAEYISELAHDAAQAGLKAVAVTALTDDGDLHTSSAVRGEGYVGEGVDQWNYHLSQYMHTHADTIDPLSTSVADTAQPKGGDA